MPPNIRSGYAMLRQEIVNYELKVLTVMSDIAIIAASVKVALLDIAKQSSALGTGLQNVAPGAKDVAPNKSVQYLLESSDFLVKKAQECEEFLAPYDKN